MSDKPVPYASIGLHGFIHKFTLVDAAGNIVDSWEEHNLVPQAGLDFLIQAPYGDISPIAVFYAGLYRGNYIPSAVTKASDIPSVMNECLTYSESARPIWQRRYDGVGTLDNSADGTRAVFTFTADATVYGSFLVSSSVKGGGTGLLLSVVRFSSPRVISAGLTLNLTTGITYIPTNVV